MSKDFDAVAFDLDGTLYPNYRLYVRLIPFIIREHRLLRAMGKARDALREAAQEGRFYDIQARIMAEILQDDPERVQSRTEELIYRGWEPLFRGVKPFPHVRETLASLRSCGLKLGILSDFPPERKLEYLDLAGDWDAVLCSERIGRLKPDPAPFEILCRTLGASPGRTLYVGNSVAYDIRGAHAFGMKTALIRHRLKGLSCSCPEADFIFSDYRQLRAYVVS